MLTQTIPALTRALQGALEPSQLKALTQSLGNCAQPLSHRGSIRLTANQYDTRSGEYPGYQWGPGVDFSYIGDSWNINNYGGGVYNNYGGDIFNNNISNNTYQGDSWNIDFGDINNIYNRRNTVYNIFNNYGDGGGGLGPGGDITIGVPTIDFPYPPGDTNVSNYYNNQFFFPTTNFYNQNIDNRSNNFFGGDSYFDNSVHNNSVHNNINSQNINITNINGQPIEGPAGPPGEPGRDGRNGAPGAPGAVIGVPVIPPPGRPPDFGSRKITFLRGANPTVNLPALKTEDTIAEVTVKEYSFDKSTCDLQVTEKKVPVNVPGQEIGGAPAALPVQGLVIGEATVLVPG